MRDGFDDDGLRETVLRRSGYSASALRRAAHRASSADRVAHRAWQLIAASQKLLSSRAIRGGASDPLDEKIRAALRSGVLPQIDERLWAGKARGDRACACCTLPIARGEVEDEPQAAPGLYAHLRCFTSWRAESGALDGNNGQQRRAANDTT